jgi:hypothetical protein
MHFKWE